MIAVRYTIMRLMVFAGFFAVLTLLRVPMIWAAVAAALLSMVASYFLLAPDRERLAAGLEHKVEDRIARRRAAVDEGRTLEEEEDAEADGHGRP
ncbi:DUF4229 domain-containing protein [Ornithinimicrobium sp. Y1694]|uniref:DUF4229 domain-containing protein n=1 Tax=Ornithinimicrobium sp. Y1694 TaxID=3418590 RepID=UPI003CEDC845